MGIAYGGIRTTILKNAKIFRYENLGEIPDGQGIYVVFEEGQTANDGLPRIVRTGKSSNLKNRLKIHYCDLSGTSTFRKLIKNSLKNSSLPAEESDVSDYIQKNISYALIRIPFFLSCDELERTLLNMVAFNSKKYAAHNWLGNKCDNEQVKKHKLWDDRSVAIKHEYTEYADLALDKYLENLFDIGLVRK
ncbi:MAG: hypothetical protein IJS67_04095 [Clostridia bacterium]|nr:hypothetical protein [Clostridia bacterium]